MDEVGKYKESMKKKCESMYKKVRQPETHIAQMEDGVEVYKESI